MIASLIAATALACPIIPRPASLVQGSFAYHVPSLASISSDKDCAGAARFLGAYLSAAGIAISRGEHGVIDLRIAPGRGDESYTLDISPIGIEIRAPGPAGAFYAVQSLRQLIGLQKGNVELPCVHIQDEPRFPWRGMHLDCSRHFFTVQEIKKYIDYLAEFKFNIFHWHLIDEGGWRMEVKKYSKLTDIGAWRTSHPEETWNYANLEFPSKESGKPLYGGYYKQIEIREIVKYAADRYITIVPEIEMPGHCLPALTAYPEVTCSVEKGADRPYRTTAYCPGKEATFKFIESVLDETMSLFPSKVIHIGGDEVDKYFWSRCPDCQRRMQDQGLKDVQELQSYFIKRVEKYLNSKGRDLMGWDEILEGGLAPNAMVMSWRGIEGGIEAAKSGHRVVMSPTSHCYFDYGYDGTSTEHVYGYEPVPAELSASEGKLVLGAQANVWTEWMPNFKRVEYMIFPRILAMAEALWTNNQRKDYPNFEARLNTYYPVLISRDVDFYTGVPRADVGLILFRDSCQVSFSGPKVPGVELKYTLDGTLPSAKSPTYAGPITVTKECVVTAAFVRGGKIAEKPVTVTCRKAIETAESSPGISFRVFEGTFSHVPLFNKLTAKATGTAQEFDIQPYVEMPSFAMQWAGWLRVETEGVYTFTLGSDDGSVMRIAGATVVDNDAPQAYTERSGKAYLLPGVYPFEIGYFEQGGAEKFTATVSAPGAVAAPLSTLVLKQ